MGDDNRKKGKIYRYCFGIQKETYTGIRTDKAVPSFFRNLYMKDVTANYIGNNTLTVPIIPSKEKYAYLGVFSPTGWIPVALGKIEKETVSFRDVESDIIYQPLFSDGKSHRPAGYPFLWINGEIQQLQPDTIHTTEAVLTRKMSLIPSISRFLYRNIINSRIEGSADSSFSKINPLLIFTDTLASNYHVFTPISKELCRFVRYIAPEGNTLELSELTLFRDTACKEPIPLQILSRIEPLHTLSNIIDGNTLTYFQSRDSSASVVFDLGKSTEINKIAFSPRNDDNYVWPGDTYELFYQNGINGWRSLGIQIATNHALQYQIPENALLWLRNLTKGREEQVFIYRDRKQYFTFDIHGEFNEK